MFKWQPENWFKKKKAARTSGTFCNSVIPNSSKSNDTNKLLSNPFEATTAVLTRTAYLHCIT